MRQTLGIPRREEPTRKHVEKGFDDVGSPGSPGGSPIQAGPEGCRQRQSTNPASGGGRERAGIFARRPHPSRGAKAADPIWAERDRGEEDQRDPEVPLLLLGSNPLDDRSGGDPVGGGAALAGLRNHPDSASCQRPEIG